MGASAVSAQWGDYLNRILNPQKPLGAVEDQRAIIEKRVRNITSDNWRSAISNTAITEGESVADVAKEWLFYFTTSNVNGTRNATSWDSVFDVCIILFYFFAFRNPWTIGNVDGRLIICPFTGNNCSLRHFQESCRPFPQNQPRQNRLCLPQVH